MKNNPVKYIIKRTFQHIAALLGPHTKKSASPQLIILMYHRILPSDDPRTESEEPGMVVTPETFRLHLNILKKYFEIIHYSKWLELKEKGEKLPQKACVITLDDGWADNYEFAYPILKELSIPATIYLVSDMTGTGQSFWPQRLANTLLNLSHIDPSLWNTPELRWILDAETSYSFNGSAPTQDEISQIISHAKQFGDHEIHSRLDAIESKLNTQTSSKKPDLLNWEQIKEMGLSELVEFGSHTCNHVRLSSDTPLALLEDEIIRSKQVIEKRIGQPVKTFCYPNGDHSVNALNIVKAHYTGAVTTLSGWNTTSTDDHLLHRIPLHEDISNDKTAFLARISGWM